MFYLKWTWDICTRTSKLMKVLLINHLIQENVFKSLNGHSSVNKEIWFKSVDNSGPQTRNLSDPTNLRTKLCKSDIRKNFFSQRVIPHWNRLPTTMKMAPSITAFKSRYDAVFCAWDVYRCHDKAAEIETEIWWHRDDPDTLIMAPRGSQEYPQIR